jgi:hypothetical protein
MENKKKLLKMFIKNQNVHMYIFLAQTRAGIYQMSEPSSHQGGRPTTNKTATVLATTPRWTD